MNNSPFEKLNHRRLTADEIELRPRIFEAQKGSYYAELSLYLKVQTVRKVLNDIFGIENWMCRDYEVKGKDFCEISIRNPETGEWIAKGGCGGESNFFEAGKAEASDAFKRAAQNWNIGKELLNEPVFGWGIYYPVSELAVSKKTYKGVDKADKVYLYLKDGYRLELTDIKYNDQDKISELEVTEFLGPLRKGSIRWPNNQGSPDFSTSDENKEEKKSPDEQKLQTFVKDMDNLKTNWELLYKYFGIESTNQMTDEMIDEAYKIKKISPSSTSPTPASDSAPKAENSAKPTKPDALDSVNAAQNANAGAEDYLKALGIIA